MARIALAVPSIVHFGGVVSVADFLLKTLRARTDHEIRLISLAMSSRDSASVLLTDPRTWVSGPRVEPGDFRGTPYAHVGAWGAELETQRYTPRRALDRLLEGCDMVQIVAGAVAWAHPFVDCKLPVSLQAATLTAVERKARAATWSGPVGCLRRWITERIGRMETRALRAMSAVQVENPWMERHVRDVTEGRAVDIRFAPPGIDETLFHPVVGPRRGGYFLSVGRMGDPRKNHRMLLDAYVRLRARLPDCPRLVLAGPDMPPDWMTRIIADRSLPVEIVHRPETSTLADLYRHADAFVLASDEEGFGVTVVEAMASGRPPVSTRSGGPDAIITDGRDGFLVDRDDAETLAGRLYRIATEPNLADALGREARATAEARYGEQAAGAAFVDAIEAVLERGRGQ